MLMEERGLLDRQISSLSPYPIRVRILSDLLKDLGPVYPFETYRKEGWSVTLSMSKGMFWLLTDLKGYFPEK